MESNPKSAFVHSQPSLLSLLCLGVFLPYLLLPAIYYSHLTEALLPASQEDPRAGPLAIGTHPEKPPGPYHDSDSCPICRTASSFQDYEFFSLPQAPECATQVRLAAFISPLTPSPTRTFWHQSRVPRSFPCNFPVSQSIRLLRFLPEAPLGDPGISLKDRGPNLFSQPADQRVEGKLDRGPKTIF